MVASIRLRNQAARQSPSFMLGYVRPKALDPGPASRVNEYIMILRGGVFFFFREVVDVTKCVFVCVHDKNVYYQHLDESYLFV